MPEEDPVTTAVDVGDGEGSGICNKTLGHSSGIPQASVDRRQYRQRMSVKVDLDQLAGTLADYPFGYLITVGDDYQAHTVSITPVLRGGVLDIGEVGNSTRRNICGHPDATVLWPPARPGGYSLIVDGRGELTDDSLRVVPHRAVLHRPAQPNIATASGCGDDCVPLT